MQNQQIQQKLEQQPNNNTNDQTELKSKVKLHSKSELYVSNYRLNCAKRAKTVSVFTRRLLTAPLNVIDLYRTNVTGSSAKRYDRKTFTKHLINMKFLSMEKKLICLQPQYSFRSWKSGK